MKTIPLKKVIYTFLAILLLFLSCKIMMIGIGGGFSDRKALLLMILIILCSSSKKGFYFFIIPLVSIYAIYTPVGFFFGGVSYQYIASIFATDTKESVEFFKNIPIKNYFLGLLVVPCVLAYYKIINSFNIKLYKNKSILSVFIIIAMLQQAPFKFFNDSFSATKQLNEERQTLKELNSKNSWGESHLKKKSYDNYVLVIGESVRRDYLHAYGYPIANTPFMSKTNGITVDGLTAAGTNTISSLQLMLTQPMEDKYPQYDKTFIDLANSAGIETYWISNQGYLGEYDTPISGIAQKSKNKFFIKSVSYDSLNTSDFLLLPEFKKALKNNNKKLIVIHLYGSHPNSCDRIEDFPKILKEVDDKYESINCYISSIKKTDAILKEIYSELLNEQNNNHKKFSLLYFSDHGLSSNIDGNNIKLIHGSKKSAYQIPLFVTNSDLSKKVDCKSFKSGLNFTNGLANWMSISNKNIYDYSLFDCQDDTNQNQHLHHVEKLENDPAINII